MATAAMPSSTSAVKTSTAAMKAAALMPDVCAAATVIELRVMPVVVMLFPRMVLDEVGIVVVAISPTIRVRRIAIPRVSSVTIVGAASGGGKCDHADQNQRCDRAASIPVSM